jgi:hypothetical protein
MRTVLGSPTDGSGCPFSEWRLRHVAVLLAASRGKWSRLFMLDGTVPPRWGHSNRSTYLYCSMAAASCAAHSVTGVGQNLLPRYASVMEELARIPDAERAQPPRRFVIDERAMSRRNYTPGEIRTPVPASTSILIVPDNSL